MSLVGVVTAVTTANDAAVRSTVNDGIVSGILTFPTESVTVIVQFEYVELSFRVLKVIVLLSAEDAVAYSALSKHFGKLPEVYVRKCYNI